MNVAQIQPLQRISELVPSEPPASASFLQTLGAMIDGVSNSVATADGLAAGLAAQKASVADAAIARAKADTLLEIAAVAASRVTASITSLLQTQV